MGVDFLKRTGKTFKRSWDRGRDELKTPRLFDKEVPPASRTLRMAPIDDKCTLDLGKAYVLRPLPENQIGIYDQRTLVAKGNPPAEVLTAICTSGGVGLGVVTAHYPLSGTIDVEIR